MVEGNQLRVGTISLNPVSTEPTTCYGGLKMRRIRLFLALTVSVTSFFVAFGASALDPLVTVEGQFVGIRDKRAVTVNVSVVRDGTVVQTTPAAMMDDLRFSAVLLNIQGFNTTTDRVRVAVQHAENVPLPVGFDAVNPADIVYANFVETPLSDITLDVGTVLVKWLVNVRVNVAQGVSLVSFYGDPSASIGGLLTDVFNPWPIFVVANDDNGQLRAFLQASPPASEALQPWQGFIVSSATAGTTQFWAAEWTAEQKMVPLVANTVNLRSVPFAGANITPDALWVKLVEIQAQPRALMLHDAGLGMWYVRTANFTTPLTSTQRRSFNLVPGDAWIVVPGADANLDMATLAPAAPSANVRPPDDLVEMPNEDILALADITDEQRDELSRITGIIPSRRVSPEGKLSTTWGKMKERQ